jgi:hypothetical protein
MAEDSNHAARQQVAAKVMETADQLARLLKGEKVPEADAPPTPDALLFVARDEQNRAEASIFGELVDLVLPERAQGGQGRGDRGAARSRSVAADGRAAGRGVQRGPVADRLQAAPPAARSSPRG